MQQNPDDQIALFVRDETTGWRAFNVQALKALGVDPAEARDRGYPLKDLEQTVPDVAAYWVDPTSLACCNALDLPRRLP